LINKYICLFRQDPNAPGIGTPHYSAPECFHTDTHITSKADIWSAGAILYHMTYGEAPLQDSPQPPRFSPPTRSANVADILHHCLQHNIQQRGSHSWLANHPYTRDPTVF
jgi:serine/threonine protein kinase